MKSHLSFAKALTCVHALVTLCISNVALSKPTHRAPADELHAQAIGIELVAPRRIFTVTPLDSTHWLIAGGHLEKNPKGKVSNTAELLTISEGEDRRFVHSNPP